VVGANFSGGGFIRTGNNTRQYCGECNGGCYGGVHANGEVWMGAAWKVRQNLNSTHGDVPGDFIADTLFLGWMNSFNQGQIDEIIEIQWLTLNDDDADITNGTPDYADIDAGFMAQGFPGYVLPFLIFSNVTELPDTDMPGPYLVSADIIANFNPPVASATLRYKVGGGSFIDVPMANTVGDTYEASIPSQVGAAIVDYFVTATDNLGVAQSFPAGAPGDLLSFDIGTLVIVTSDDFEGASDNGWTVGVPSDDATTGIWVRVNPVGTAAQPENDHSISGTTAWITGQSSPGGALGANDVDNGKTTLLSPVFDLSGLGEPVVSYWLWYSNNTGASPNADIFEVDISGDGGGTWSSAEVVGPSGCESNGGWIEHSFRVTDVMAPTATMRLRFVASDEGSGSLVEAALDDFAITVLGAPGCPPPTTYCTGAPNSVGSGALMGTSGSQSVASNTFGLFANGLPPTRNGIFFYGPGQASSAFGNGTLCIGGIVQRLDVVQADVFGIASFAVDLTAPPTAAGQITSGSTWNFQHWYRDPAAGGASFNLSDALAVTFCD